MNITTIIKIFAALYAVAILASWWRSRSFKRFFVELIPLVCLLILDVFIASSTAGYVTFGAADSPLIAILIMFVAILFGVAARYVFYLRGQFSWLDFVKPLCISPILLLPLIGSLQSVKSLEPVQLVSFGLLAFQNGFFWQAVLQSHKEVKTGKP